MNDTRPLTKDSFESLNYVSSTPVPNRVKTSQTHVQCSDQPLAGCHGVIKYDNNEITNKCIPAR